MAEIQQQAKEANHIQNPILFLHSERPKIEKVIQSLPRLQDKDSFFYYEHLKYRFLTN